MCVQCNNAGGGAATAAGGDGGGGDGALDIVPSGKLNEIDGVTSGSVESSMLSTAPPDEAVKLSTNAGDTIVAANRWRNWNGVMPSAFRVNCGAWMLNTK